MNAPGSWLPEAGVEDMSWSPARSFWCARDTPRTSGRLPAPCGSRASSTSCWWRLMSSPIPPILEPASLPSDPSKSWTALPCFRPWTKHSRATGMTNRQEVKIQTRGPDVGNPTPMRQGLGAGAPALLRRDAKRREAREGRSGGSRRCMTVQTKVKRRKAFASGEPARSGEARYTSEMQMYWRQDGHEVCWPYPGASAGSPLRR